MSDKEQRELEVKRFIDNKIKRCDKCGCELNYREKFYTSEPICFVCKGLLKPEAERESLGASGHYNSVDTRSPMAEKLFALYPEWQAMNEKAENEWHENHPLTPLPRKLSENHKPQPFSDERIAQMISDYDEGIMVTVSQEELISLLWEIIKHRNISG